MQITVTVPDEFAREAAARGLTVEALAEERLSGLSAAPTLTNDEAVDAMLSFAGKYGLKLREGERIADLIREARRVK